MANGLCGGCKVVLTEENASPSALKRGNGSCISCQSKYNKTKYDKNPEKYRAMSKNHRIKHPDEYKTYQKVYRVAYRLSVRSKYMRLKSASKKHDSVLDISIEEY